MILKILKKNKEGQDGVINIKKKEVSEERDRKGRTFGWTYDDYRQAASGECLFVTCQNGGRCIPKFGDYQCVCSFGFTGRNCESRSFLLGAFLGTLLGSSLSGPSGSIFFTPPGSTLTASSPDYFNP